MAAPRDREIVEVDVASPDRIRGLEHRDRLPFEFELVRWMGVVSDAELAERAAAIALPARVTDTVLGAFTLREPHNWYEANRTSLGRKRYRFVVDVGDAGAPAACLERARPAAAWVEPMFATIISTAAERMFGLWNEAWRQDDDDEEDIVDAKSFAKRLSIQSVRWVATQSTDDLIVRVDDDQLFGGYGIEVRLSGRQIASVKKG